MHRPPPAEGTEPPTRSPDPGLCVDGPLDPPPRLCLRSPSFCENLGSGCFLLSWAPRPFLVGRRECAHFPLLFQNWLHPRVWG